MKIIFESPETLHDKKEQIVAVLNYVVGIPKIIAYGTIKYFSDGMLEIKLINAPESSPTILADISTKARKQIAENWWNEERPKKRFGRFNHPNIEIDLRSQIFGCEGNNLVYKIEPETNGHDDIEYITTITNTADHTGGEPEQLSCKYRYESRQKAESDMQLLSTLIFNLQPYDDETPQERLQRTGENTEEEQFPQMSGDVETDMHNDEMRE